MFLLFHYCIVRIIPGEQMHHANGMTPVSCKDSSNIYWAQRIVRDQKHD